ncbi:MAG: insulinase family protein [Zetaproteobacteria bacterium]|nr:MAG: insulinase family protein [Zetaproteobacteria bacterium]
MRLLCLTAALLAAWPAAAAPLQRAHFANGANLVVLEDHTAPVATVQVWLKVGGRDELPGKSGLAHVFEHMMFKGSKALGPGEFSNRISAMGGNDNAFTSYDYTAYFETVPADRVAEVLRMEAERFANLRLDPREYAREIRVIMEERRMRTDDNPNARMFEELSAAALKIHPYRNPVIGWMQDLKRLTIDDVRAFYRAHYVAANVTVVVVGDVDFSEVKRVVGATFGRMPRVAVPPRFNPVEPEPLGPKRIEVHLPGVQLPMVAVVMPVPVWHPGENDREAAALAVATAILAEGRSALLTRRLVDEQRLAYSASAGYDPFSMGIDLWAAWAMLGKGNTPDALLAGLWKSIEQLAHEGPDKAQLARAIRGIVADEVFAQDSLYLRARRIGAMESVGLKAEARDRWLKLIRKVSAGDVRRVLRRWIRRGRATTGVLLPRGKEESRS